VDAQGIRPFHDLRHASLTDGSPEEAVALRNLLAEQIPDDPDAVEGIAEAVLDAGLTIAPSVPESTRAFSGDMFQAIADASSPN
jgi:hypothetical protein